jgi:hypothetical protein
MRFHLDDAIVYVHCMSKPWLGILNGVSKGGKGKEGEGLALAPNEARVLKRTSLVEDQAGTPFELDEPLSFGQRCSPSTCRRRCLPVGRC